MNLTKSERAELKKQIIEQFWNEGGQITTCQGVELDLHQDTLVVASVLLRNHEEYEDRLQLKAAFDTVEEFIDAMEVSTVDDLADISIADLLELYKQDKAEVIEE